MGRHRLTAGAPRLLGRHDGAAGRAFRRYYDALAGELGPFRPLVRLEAGRVAVLGVLLEAATHALMAARRDRETGRGRRPSVAALERLARRQGLADASYAAALDKLRALVGDRPRRRDLAALPPVSA